MKKIWSLIAVLLAFLATGVALLAAAIIQRIPQNGASNAVGYYTEPAAVSVTETPGGTLSEAFDTESVLTETTGTDEFTTGETKTENEPAENIITESAVTKNALTESAATESVATESAITESVATEAATENMESETPSPVKLFAVFTDDSQAMPQEFYTFAEAAAYADKITGSYVYYGSDGSIIWESGHAPDANGKLIAAPFIEQLPELDNGCEVTSLAMLINYMGGKTDKLRLAEEIKKDTTAYNKTADGVIYYGNPNDGFVGNIYGHGKRGYGVYHGPIFALLQTYFEKTAVDLTGCAFDDLYYFLDEDIPVWVIINSAFGRLPQSAFETWQTPTGPVTITYKEHSVLVTGYDNNYIYFNDPYYGGGVSKAAKKGFIAAWEQMGSQAVTVAK